MESTVRRSEIGRLKARLEAAQVICRSLEREFVEDSLTADQRIKVFRRWDATLMEIEEGSLELKSLERQEREELIARVNELQIE